MSSYRPTRSCGCRTSSTSSSAQRSGTSTASLCWLLCLGFIVVVYQQPQVVQSLSIPSTRTTTTKTAFRFGNDAQRRRTRTGISSLSSSLSSSSAADSKRTQANGADDNGEEDDPLAKTRVPPVRYDVTEMPPFLDKEQLHNTYYLLRHGQSTANVAEIISSSRSLAYTTKHGLTDTGYQQGKASAQQLLNILEGKIKNENNKKQTPTRVVFVSSPFARAVQTAYACLDGLAEPDAQERAARLGLDVSTDVVYNNCLVERYFGRLDAEAIYTYAYVWPLDKFDCTHAAFDVESVAAVAARIRSGVIRPLERRYTDCHIVLTSHADVLQIAQLYAAASETNDLNVGEFSSYRFANGEVREMTVGTGHEHLPPPAPLEKPERGTSAYTALLAKDKNAK